MGHSGRVTLREITAANRSAVESLRVTPAQTAFVVGVAESLVEAAETPGPCSTLSSITCVPVPQPKGCTPRAFRETALLSAST